MYSGHLIYGKYQEDAGKNAPMGGIAFTLPLLGSGNRSEQNRTQ
jgi:hypothetical protein